MGVPRLAPWIISMFREFYFQFSSIQKNYKSVNHLYIDGNAILHKIAQRVYNYGAEKRFMDTYKDLSPKEKQLKVYELFFEEIVIITKIIVPTETLIIAIDGSAPIAKQAQQRQRRFVSAYMSEKKEFDSNCLSPGTRFMQSLDNYMRYAIRKEMNNVESGSDDPKGSSGDPKGMWHDLKVVFSPPTVPGEGEHKLLDFLRLLPMEKCIKDEHCFVGPDGDLLMLTLAAHVSHIYLFRDDLFNPGMYQFFDMGKIRERIGGELYKNFTQNACSLESNIPMISNIKDVINDFILLGFFVGNDFLPMAQMFIMLEKGLELMIHIYSKNYSTYKRGLTKNGKIDYKGFLAFIEEVAKCEEQYTYEQSFREIKPGEERFENNTLLKNTCVSEQKLDFKNYRIDYYSKATTRTEEEIKQMCIEYIKSIVWVFLYYVKGLPSWTHFYPYHYPPLMVDVARVMREDFNKEFSTGDVYSFPPSKPLHPFMQLLCVLPPKSANLLPLPLRSLIKSSTLRSLYPEKFEIDYEGKMKDHMAIILLPFITHKDRKVLSKKYVLAKKEFRKKYKRNMISKNITFVYSREKVIKYISKYGSIDRCKISVLKDE